MLQAKVEMLRTNLEAARTEAAAADSLRKEVATLRSQLTAGSADMVAAVAEASGDVSTGDGHLQALQQELAQVCRLLVDVVQQAACADLPRHSHFEHVQTISKSRPGRPPLLSMFFVLHC